MIAYSKLWLVVIVLKTFGAHMNILFIVTVKMLVDIKGYIDAPPLPTNYVDYWA